MASKKRSDEPTEPVEGQVKPPRGLPPLWQYWRGTWEFFSPVYGSVPADPEVIKAWLTARAPRVRPPGGKSIDEVNEEVLATLSAPAEEETAFQILTFQYGEVEGERAICFRHDTLRAHIKDCARVLSAQYMGRVEGERAFSTKVINGLYIDHRRHWIELRRPDGALITKPDGEVDKFVHTRYGSAMKRLQYVEPPVVISFLVQTLGHSIKQEELEYLASYGGIHGYGGERSMDGGKYHGTFEPVPGEPRPIPRIQP